MCTFIKETHCEELEAPVEITTPTVKEFYDYHKGAVNDYFDAEKALGRVLSGACPDSNEIDALRTLKDYYEEMGGV